MREEMNNASEDIYRLEPWYHSFESFGVRVQQCEGHYAINQKCKEGIILAYLQLAIEKSKSFCTDSPSVLELFCADGYYAAHAKRMGAGIVTGVDLDEKAIEQAKAMHRKLFDQPGNFLVSDINTYETIESYDVVLCCGGLYHLSDPQRVIEFSHKLSKRFLIVQSVVSLENESEDYFISPAPGWKHGSRFSAAFLRKLLQQAGWHIVDEHYNELEGNNRPCDRGSAYFICTNLESTQFEKLQHKERIVTTNGNKLYDTPNKYAPPAQLEFNGNEAHVDGYQGFVLTRESLIPLQPDSPLGIKHRLLSQLFHPTYFNRRTVLDLGANAGFFSFLALQHGADRAIAIEMDNDYIKIMEDIKKTLGFSNLSIVNANVENWHSQADVVFAFALVHWLYSCTAAFGSLDSIIEKFSRLSNYMLIVEWVDPSDPAISFFHHLDWNKEFVKEPYTREAFEVALGRHFARFDYIADISPSRRLYVAFRMRHEIDLSCPLPLLADKQLIISCRLLITWDKMNYWSCVYDVGNAILKQATLDLAEREAYFLRQLKGHYFPKVINMRKMGEYSTITIEKIPGIHLRDRMLSEIDTPSKFYEFVVHCLNILGLLREKAILHRDIRIDNMFMCEGMPILIDFGWAVSPERQYFSPLPLGGSERPPDGSFCDVYSMGKVMEQVNAGRFSEFDNVINLMTQTVPAMRLTDICLLRVCFEVIAKSFDLEEF